MLDFFEMLWSYIVLFFDYLINTIEMLITFIFALSTAIQIPAGIYGYLPAIIGSSMLVVVAIAVIKLLIGRENS